MPMDRKPDAVIFNDSLFGRFDPKKIQGDKLGRMQAALAPLLGVKRVYMSILIGGAYFVTDRVSHEGKTLQFETGHPREREERYDWYVMVADGAGGFSLGEPLGGWQDAPDKLKAGFLVAHGDAIAQAEDDARAKGESTIAAAARAGLVEALKNDPERLDRYVKTMGKTDEELSKSHPELKAALDARRKRLAPPPPTPPPPNAPDPRKD